MKERPLVRAKVLSAPSRAIGSISSAPGETGGGDDETSSEIVCVVIEIRKMMRKTLSQVPRTRSREAKMPRQAAERSDVLLPILQHLLQLNLNRPR